MADTQLLIQPRIAKIADLTIDASISEQHNSEVDVTDHAVEEGANISDHARVKPLTLQIEGLVSDTPVTRAQAVRIVESLGVQFSSNALQDARAGEPGFAQTALSILEKIRDDRQLIKVVTALRSYDDMLLTSLQIPRNATSGDALRFTASFKQVRFARNKVTFQKVTKTPQGKKKANKGSQSSTTSSSAEQAEVRRSLLKSASDSTGLTSLLGI